MSNVVIVGSGVVGTATGKGFARLGHDVLFVDVDAARVEALRQEGLIASDRITVPSAKPSFVFLTLPTPSNGQAYDLSTLAAGTRSVGRALRESRAFHTVVVRSTVPPGTCDNLVTPILEAESGKAAGRDFGVASNPEFLRAASAEEDFAFPWMTVIASRSRRTVERLQGLFQPFGGEVRTFSNPAAAELVKCSHNVFNATKISFWNEIWLLSQHLGLDADAIAATVARSAEGSYNPEYGIRGGLPYGGVCLPKDTEGLLGFAGTEGVDMPLLRAVIEVNGNMERLRELEMAVAATPEHQRGLEPDLEVGVLQNEPDLDIGVLQNEPGGPGVAA
jgi:UDPglucose 6-dehydrogenase